MLSSRDRETALIFRTLIYTPLYLLHRLFRFGIQSKRPVHLFITESTYQLANSLPGTSFFRNVDAGLGTLDNQKSIN
jgi:hypothetical protein